MSADPGNSCATCPAAALTRRTFLRDVGLSVAAAIAATALVPPDGAFADSITGISPRSPSAPERSYDLPARDGVFLDEANDLILARWEGRAYAFSIFCPHKGARLEWRQDEGRVFCPKHKARFAPDGAHVSGRGSRDLDRYALRRAGNTLLVDFSQVLRADRDGAAWRNAFAVI